METKDIYFFSLALVAEVIGTVSGFGSSILFVPIAALFFDFHVVLGITAVFHVFSNLSKIVLFRKGIHKNIAIKLGVPAVLAVMVGAILTQFIPVKLIEIIMSVVLVLLSLFLVFNQQFKMAQNNTNLYSGGLISGFLAGLIGTGGAIRGLTMVAFNLEKNVFVATSALIDMGVDSSRAVIYIWNGFFTSAHLKYIPFLIVISLIGSYLGKRILAVTSQNAFRYLALTLIVATSILQVIKLLKS